MSFIKKLSHAFSQISMQNFFKAFCKDSGISVRWDKMAKVAHSTTKGSMTLPHPNAVNAGRFWKDAYHEAAHLHPKVKWTMNYIKDISKDKPPTSPEAVQQRISMSLIDHIVERNQNGEYKGRDNILYDGQVDFFKDNPNYLKKIEPLGLECALQAIDIKERSKWQGVMPPVKIPKSVQHMVDALDKMSLGDKLKEIAESGDRKQLEELISQIMKLQDLEPDFSECQGEGQEGDGDSKEKQPCEACDGTGKEPGTEGQGEDGEGEPCEACGGSGQEPGQDGEGEGQGKGEGQGQPGEGAGMDGDGEGEEGEHNMEKKHGRTKDMGPAVQSLLNRNNFKMIEQVEKNSWEDIYYQRRDSGKEYIPLEETVVHKIKDTGGYNTPDAEAIRKILGGSTVSKGILKYLKVMNRDANEYGKTRGKIHNKNMHRIYNHKGSGIPRIFKEKKASHLKTDTAVMILLDQSGSMRGGNYQIGAACCIALSETLRDIRIPHALLAFTSCSDQNHMYHYKDFAEKSVSRQHLVSRFGISRKMAGNADGESIMYSAEYLMTQTQKNKILVVLSDGEPAGGGMGDEDAYLRHVCKMIEDDSPIHLFGIGICSNAVKRYYKSNVVVSDPSQLDATLIPLIRDNIVIGG